MEAAGMVMDKKYKRSIKKSFDVLDKATTLALEHRDVDSLIAIADRWIIFAERLSDGNIEELPIGFISQEKNDRDKASDKRKS
jgi:hypothetical protein